MDFFRSNPICYLRKESSNNEARNQINCNLNFRRKTFGAIADWFYIKNPKRSDNADYLSVNRIIKR